MASKQISIVFLEPNRDQLLNFVYASPNIHHSIIGQTSPTYPTNLDRYGCSKYTL